MGITRFNGPVYGAKGLLWAVGPAAAASTSASTVNAYTQPGFGRRTVPLYEDWLVTEVWGVCSTCSTVAGAVQYILKVEGGSTLVPRSNGQSSTNAANVATITGGGSSNLEKLATAGVTPGEYEGTWCPAGSTLRFVSSYADIPVTPQFNVYGYIRYIDSTRAV